MADRTRQTALDPGVLRGTQKAVVPTKKGKNQQISNFLGGISIFLQISEIHNTMTPYRKMLFFQIPFLLAQEYSKTI